MALATVLFEVEAMGEEAVEEGTEGGAEVEGVTGAVLLGVALAGVLWGAGGGDTECSGINGTIEVGSAWEFVVLFLGGIFGACAVVLLGCEFGSGGSAFEEDEAAMGVPSELGVFELPFEVERAFIPTTGIS